jgi:hypothetical protein
MNSVQEIGREIEAEYPHPLQEMNLSEFCLEVQACASDFDITVTAEEVLAIAQWVGFDAYSEEEILEAWQTIQ